MNPKNLPDIRRGSVPAANNYPTQQPVNCGTRFTSNFVQKHHLYDRGKGPKKVGPENMLQLWVPYLRLTNRHFLVQN
jgi:hypothetical protein